MIKRTVIDFAQRWGDEAKGGIHEVKKLGGASRHARTRTDMSTEIRRRVMVVVAMCPEPEVAKALFAEASDVALAAATTAFSAPTSSFCSSPCMTETHLRI